MEVGVIFLSKAETPEMQEMTQDAITTCIESDPKITFKVIVMESAINKSNITYKNALTLIAPDDLPFNYNQYLNIARQHSHVSECPYLALCNNDLLFTKNWATNIINAMEREGVMSACPMEPNIHAKVKFKDGVSEGKTVTAGDRHVAGWCIVQNSKIYDTIQNLDTTCNFWHSDVFYAAQLGLHNLPHILVEDSKVHHLTSKTLNSPLISESTRENYTHGQDPHLVELIRRGFI